MTDRLTDAELSQLEKWSDNLYPSGTLFMRRVIAEVREHRAARTLTSKFLDAHADVLLADPDCGCKRLTSDGVGYGEHDLSWVTEVRTVDAIDTVAVDALMANGSWRLLHVGSGNGGQTTMTFGWPAAEADRD